MNLRNKRCPGTEANIHVIPIDDIRMHSAQTTCWCFPLKDDEDPNIYTHHARDLREASERREDGRATKGWTLVAEWTHD